MARPLRIQFPGAVYHVTARGNRREEIFTDDADRHRLLAVLGAAVDRFDACVLAYCLMGNHYHLVLQTRQPNLSRFMRHLNGVYTQAFNRRHVRVGHVFQGRFNAIVVDSESYLLTLCRYVELNPVRAGIVAQPANWTWSSHRAHIGLALVPSWLDTAKVHAWVLGMGGAQGVGRRWANWVEAGIGQPLWPGARRQQIYLGAEDFVSRVQAQLDPLALARLKGEANVPRAQISTPLTLAQWLATCPTREQALRAAYRESGITMTQLAQEVGLSVSRVSRLIALADEQNTGSGLAFCPLPLASKPGGAKSKT